MSRERSEQSKARGRSGRGECDQLCPLHAIHSVELTMIDV